MTTGPSAAFGPAVYPTQIEIFIWLLVDFSFRASNVTKTVEKTLKIYKVRFCKYIPSLNRYDKHSTSIIFGKNSIPNMTAFETSKMGKHVTTLTRNIYHLPQNVFIENNELILPRYKRLLKACVHYFLANFNFFSKWQPFTNCKCFLFHQKSYFRSWDSHFCNFLSFFSTLSNSKVETEVQDFLMSWIGLHLL